MLKVHFIEWAIISRTAAFHQYFKSVTPQQIKWFFYVDDQICSPIYQQVQEENCLKEYSLLMLWFYFQCWLSTVLYIQQFVYGIFHLNFCLCFRWFSFLILNLGLANVFFFLFFILLNAADREGGCCKHNSTPNDDEANHTMAILCFLGRGHVLLASQQHVPPSLVPLQAFIIHPAQA